MVADLAQLSGSVAFDLVVAQDASTSRSLQQAAAAAGIPVRDDKWMQKVSLHYHTMCLALHRRIVIKRIALGQIAAYMDGARLTW